MDDSRQPNESVRAQISSTIRTDEQVLVNAQLLSGNEELRLRDLHLGNHYAPHRDVNFYFANRDLFEHGTYEQRRSALLNSLQYTGENAKRDQLDLLDVGPDNFSWVKKSPLCAWLQDGTSPFWISGKPGSGKSTLMRHLSTTHWVREQLGAKNDGTWRVLHFFFDFRSRAEDANTLRGAMKSFLQQMIRSDKKAAEFLMRPENEAIVKESPSDIVVWIQLIADATQNAEARFCAFVDGLDEHENSLAQLCSHLEHFQDKTGIKICMASRPEAEIVLKFGEYETFAMQNYNGDSIERYVRQRFTNHLLLAPRMARLFTDELRTTIKTRAEGVILWARLAVDELLRSCGPDTTEDYVQDLLYTLKPEVESLYARLLSRIPQQYQADAAWFLLLVTQASPTISLAAFLQAIVFARKDTNSFLGGDLDQATILFRSKALLGNLLDFGTDTKNHNRTDFNERLPSGWEKRYDVYNRLFYVDHNTKTTTWDNPVDILLSEQDKTFDKTGRSVHDDIQKVVSLNPRQTRAPGIRLLHYTFAFYLSESRWIEQYMREEQYSGPRAWADLLQAVLISAEEAKAVNVERSKTALWELVKVHQYMAFEIDFHEGAHVQINPGIWQAQSDLLKHSIHEFPHHFNGLSDAEPVSDHQLKLKVFLNSQIITCHLCWTCMAVLQWRFTRSPIDHLWSSGYYDLVFAYCHGPFDYLAEAISSANFSRECSHSLLGLLLFDNELPRSKVDDVYECLIKQVLATEPDSLAYHLCRSDLELGTTTNRVLWRLRIAFEGRRGPWTELHTPECDFRNTSVSSICHWASSAFDSLETCAAMLKFLIDAGASVSNEGLPESMTLFDLVIYGKNLHEVKGLFLRKVQHLAELGCKPGPNWIRWKTLDRAGERHRTWKEDERVIKQDLSAVIACLRYFRKKKAWPDFDQVRREHLNDE